MKKSLIWLLTIVMGITFGALLYFQIMYLENMVKMRESQFSEGVMRSLHATAAFLERQETLHFLEEDVNILETSMFSDNNAGESTATSGIQSSSLASGYGFQSPTVDVADRYRSLQDAVKNQYLYQRGLLDEVVLTILSDGGSRPALERADSTQVRAFLTHELGANGIELPYTFAIGDERGNIVYSSKGFALSDKKEIYSDVLFPNSNIQYRLMVEFPSKTSYIFSSVRFIIPTLALTLFLLLIFLFTIILAFRQKKISEMKSDFINNMTHELKTPTSSISLAAQMLGDESISKSPQMLKHLSNVISEESKRLLFQIDKVLQLSVFDDTNAALKFSEIDANAVIENVANNFKIRVERHGGSITVDTAAEDALIYVDGMQFNNVINNLLENAVKYRRDDEPPRLKISTRDTSGHQLEIKVRDNGLGIRKEDLKHIFEKFFRVSTGNRHDVKGFGLGLAYVKKMVSLFSGTISADSEYGKWTEFTILIPLSNRPDKKNKN